MASLHLIASFDSPAELGLLLLVALLLFGAKRLPEIGRSLGSGLREFKNSVSGEGGLSDTVNDLKEIQQSVSPTALLQSAPVGPSTVAAPLPDDTGAAGPPETVR